MAAQQQIVLDLINNPTDTNQRNIELLKKYILVCNRGWLLINGSPPDKQFTFAQYLVDDEKIMLDFTRLSKAHKKKLNQWLITPHEQDSEHIFVDDYKVNEYRGYPAEVRLNWWGRIKNSWIFKRKYHEVKLSPIRFNTKAQLNSIDYYQSENGILFGLNHLNIDDESNKYARNDDEQIPLRNTKRLYLSDDLVDELLNMDLKKVDYEKLLNKPHPNSIYIKDYQKRTQRMQDYRRAHLYTPVKSRWSRLLSKLTSWVNSLINLFHKTPASTESNSAQIQQNSNEPKKSSSYSFYKDDRIEVRLSPDNDLLLVTEKRPEVDRLVFCGGGAKIFGHWGAFEYMFNHGIVPDNYVGSSAGAIMATFCYLGYTPDQIKDYFEKFNRKVLVHNAFDRRGFSNTTALKSAIDRVILDKFIEIRDNNLGTLESSDEGLEVLDIFNKTGKITFGMLATLKKLCPDCSLKNSLTVTVTNATRGKTRIFSTLRDKDKDVEVAEVVKISSSIPGVFKSTEVDGQLYMDGGILKNLPLGVLGKSKETFLESHYGHDFGELGLQFNNGGVERNILDQMQERVYREGFIINKVLSWLTGIDDPVSGWEEDRNKLRQYALQTMVIEVGNIGSMNFNISEQDRYKLIDYGRKSAENYIKQHYCKVDSHYEMDELLYETFYLEELLCYCAYRKEWELFEKLVDKVRDSSEITYPEKQSCLNTAKRLREEHAMIKNWYKDANTKEVRFQNANKTLLLFSTRNVVHSIFSALVPMFDQERVHTDEQLFRGFHDIILKDWSKLLGKNDPMSKVLNQARRDIRRPDMSSYVNKLATMMENIEGETHLIGYLFKAILTYAKKETIDVFLELSKCFCSVFDNENTVTHMQNINYTGHWNLTIEQSQKLLILLREKGTHEADNYLIQLKTVEEVNEFQQDFDDELSTPKIALK